MQESEIDVEKAVGKLRILCKHIQRTKMSTSNVGAQLTATSASGQHQPPGIIYKKFDDGFVVRQMVRSDIPIITDLHAKEDVASCDFEVAFDAMEDKHGLIVGEYRGEPIAFFTSIKWADSPGIYYGGGFIVDKRFRGKGFGYRVNLTEILDILAYKPGDVMVGDAVDGHRLQSNVQKHNYSYHCVVNCYSLSPVPLHITPTQPLADVTIANCQDLSLDAIMDYDALCFVSKHFPVRREFLRRWFLVRPGASYAALDKNGRIVGYACRRRFRCDKFPDEKLNIIGPLYADDARVAETLILRHARDVIEETLDITIISETAYAEALVKSLGMMPVVTLYRNQWQAGGKMPLLTFSPRLFAPTSLDVCGF